jgi:hypothetical protein
LFAPMTTTEGYGRSTLRGAFCRAVEELREGDCVV